MNRARAIFSALRFSNSLLSDSIPVNRRRLLSQVTQLSPSSPYFLLDQFHTCHFSTDQKPYFSSKPSSIVQRLVVNDWSSELETELENSIPILNHETIIYILRSLDKDHLKAWNFFNWLSKRNDFKPSSPIYSLLLRVFAKPDSMWNFWITLGKMKEQGFYIDEQTYSAICTTLRQEKMEGDLGDFKQFYNRMVKEDAIASVVKSVVNVILEAEWGNEVEKELGYLGISLTDEFVIRVLKELTSYPTKALQFFRWVCKSEAYECNTVTYNVMVRVLARGDSIGEFWSVVEEMRNVGHEMDMDTYIKISRKFQHNMLIDDAVKLYEFMMDNQFRPSDDDCSLLLRSIGLSDAPDMSLVERVVRKYEATGSFLSKAIYDGIHRCLMHVGKFDEAEHIRTDMKNAGYEPDNITYNQLMIGLCKAKKLEEAYRVLNEMEAHGCVPDIKTWTALIRGYCAANQVDKALKCFTKMMEANLNADAGLLDVLINGLLSENRIDGAYTLFLEIVSKVSLRPLHVTFKLLIEKLLGERKIEEAFKLLRLMKMCNYLPYAAPFDAYISKFGTVEDAVELLKTLTVKGYPPSTCAHVHVFKSFFNEGRFSEAKRLLHKCPHHIQKHPQISKLFGSAKTGAAAA